MKARTTATAALREEHRLILQVALALEELLAASSRAQLPLGEIRRCITFFRLFADACHHGQEEDLLFTALEAHDPQATAGAIQLMRDEHAYGRALVARMQHASDSMMEGNGDAADALVASALAYIGFIRDHIRKEDGGLFDVADDVLHGGACAALCEAYDGACRQRFGGYTVDELRDLAAAIIERQPPGRGAPRADNVAAPQSPATGAGR
jgi:hemerythrin-like domain-containing protein